MVFPDYQTVEEVEKPLSALIIKVWSALTAITESSSHKILSKCTTQTIINLANYRQ